MEDLQEQEWTATLGEPDVVGDWGQYFNDPRIVIPLYDVPFSGNQNLVFEMPDNREDGSSVFLHLLDLFGADFKSMEEIQGETVPVFFNSGNATVSWTLIEEESEEREEEEDWSEVSYIGEKTAQNLHDAGFETNLDIQQADEAELLMVDGLGAQGLQNLIEFAR